MIRGGRQVGGDGCCGAEVSGGVRGPGWGDGDYVARRYGVARRTVHGWQRRYASPGLAGLVDRWSKPDTCPHQTPAKLEARIVEMRKTHPGWGPRTIGYYLQREGVDPVPSIYRCLVRHGLIDPQQRRRRRSDYKRWERARAMSRGRWM